MARNTASTRNGVIDSYTKLLVHFDGDDGATAHIARTGQTLTFTSGQLDTAQKKFGGSSLLLPGGSGSDGVTVPDSADWVLGAGDWTVDYWIRFTSVANAWYWGQYIDGNNRIGATYSGGSIYALYTVDGGVAKANYNLAWSPSTATWYHLAHVRAGDTFELFIDGVAQTLTETTPLPASYSFADLATTLKIGGCSVSDGIFNGWIDEFRVSKGIARWTSNFTPPAREYPRNLASARGAASARNPVV